MASKVKRWVAADGSRAGLNYACAHCGIHTIVTEGGGAWGWDGNEEAPTFTPSVLLTDPSRNRVCHSFVRGGMVEYLNDCTHADAGKTVPLPDLPDWL